MSACVILYTVLISSNTHTQDGLLESNIVNNILNSVSQFDKNVTRVTVELPIGRFGWGTRNRGRARTDGDVEEERIGGRGNVLPEEGEPQNRLQERTAQGRARPTSGVWQQQLRKVKDGKALAGEYVTTHYKPVVFEVRMKKWMEKRTLVQRILSVGSARMKRW